MIDYLNIIPQPPLTAEEIESYARIREMASKINITFVTPKFEGGVPIGELMTWVGAHPRVDFSSSMIMHMVKARPEQQVVFFDFESSFDPDKYMICDKDKS